MQKEVEIKYERSLKINRGNYEQVAPLWADTVRLKFNGETPEQIADIEKAEYDILKARIDKRADDEWANAKISLAGFRIREKDGKKYPGVTTILSPEPYTGNPEYGTRGTEVHLIVDHFIDKGEWREPKVKLETLSYDDIKYQEFFQEHGKEIKPIKGDYTNLKVFNDDLMYSGEIDRLLSVLEILSIVDYKTGGWKWGQLVAYWYALPEKIRAKIKQLAIFDLKKCELKLMQVGSPEFDKEWTQFIYKRGVFFGRFGV